MNSSVGLIFNKKFVEKRGLWVSWTIHGPTEQCKFGYQQGGGFVLTCFSINKEKKKKKKPETQMQDRIISTWTHT